MDSLESFLSEEIIPSTSQVKISFTRTPGIIDPRIRELSYSSLLTLHSCPRKFELYKLRTTNKIPETEKQNITFAYGHVVGQAIQDCLSGMSEQSIVLRMFIGWHADLMAEDTKPDKSFWTAVIAIKKFIAMRESGFLADYELVTYKGKPACELSFAVSLPDGFRLRGFVDAVLRNRITGEVIVLELKTTGLKVINPSTYKNSAQAIGYSVVLDVLFPELSSYRVLYVIYQTHKQEYTPLEFKKTYLQRAQWIKELLLDVEMIKLYEQHGVYPMHGESCFAFFSDCTYINSCQMSTSILANGYVAEEEQQVEFQINLTLLDLLEAQERKVGLIEPSELEGSVEPVVIGNDVIVEESF